MVGIVVDKRRALAATRRLEREFNKPQTLMEALARGYRDNVRRRMNTQDGGNWAKASKWTRAKKNTNRALAGQARNVTMIFASPRQALVVYQGASSSTGKPITLTEHHFGKVLPATGALVEVPIRNPRPLGLAAGRDKVFFRWLKDSSVPARKIWPDAPGEAQRIAEPILARWMGRIVARVWK